MYGLPWNYTLAKQIRGTVLSSRMSKGGGGGDKYMHLLVHKPENEIHYIQIQKIPVVILWISVHSA